MYLVLKGEYEFNCGSYDPFTYLNEIDFIQDTADLEKELKEDDYEETSLHDGHKEYKSESDMGEGAFVHIIEIKNGETEMAGLINLIKQYVGI